MAMASPEKAAESGLGGSPPSEPLTINLLVVEELQAAPGTPISR